MKLVRCLTHAAVVLACCGLLMPQHAVAATPKAKAIPDIALTANGSLTGHLVNPEGQPLDGAVVTIRHGGQEVAKAVSNAQGAFSVNGLSNGIYEVAVGQQSVPVRVWSAAAAPPTALTQAVIVVGGAARGQTLMGLDIITLWTLAASTGALVLSAVNQSDLNKLNKKVDDILDELKSP